MFSVSRTLSLLLALISPSVWAQLQPIPEDELADIVGQSGSLFLSDHIGPK